MNVATKKREVTGRGDNQKERSRWWRKVSKGFLELGFRNPKTKEEEEKYRREKRR